MSTGYGEQVATDDEWSAARRELSAAPSLLRIGAHARFSVATISVGGASLTALGLVTAADLATTRPVRILAYAAAGTAFVALVAALSYVGLRLDRLNTSNLDEVRDYYAAQFRRAWRVWLASRLLLVAVVLAGAAALEAAVAHASPDEPVLSLVLTDGAEPELTAGVTVVDLDPGAELTVTVTGSAGEVVLEGKTTADADGRAGVEGTVPVERGDRYRMVVRVEGEVRDEMQIRQR